MSEGSLPEAASAPASEPAKKPHVGSASQNRCVYIRKVTDERAQRLLAEKRNADASYSFSKLVDEALVSLCDAADAVKVAGPTGTLPILPLLSHD